MKNYYKILGLSKDASLWEIKKAYRELAKQYHPDKNSKGADQFMEIKQAYEVLKDQTSRAIYDEKLRESFREPIIDPVYFEAAKELIAFGTIIGIKLASSIQELLKWFASNALEGAVSKVKLIASNNYQVIKHEVKDYIKHKAEDGVNNFKSAVNRWTCYIKDKLFSYWKDSSSLVENKNYEHDLKSNSELHSDDLIKSDEL